MKNNVMLLIDRCRMYSSDPWLLARMITDLQMLGVRGSHEVTDRTPLSPFDKKLKLCIITVSFPIMIRYRNQWRVPKELEFAGESELYFNLTQSINNKTYNATKNILTEESYDKVLAGIINSFKFKWR